MVETSFSFYLLWPNHLILGIYCKIHSQKYEMCIHCSLFAIAKHWQLLKCSSLAAINHMITSGLQRIIKSNEDSSLSLWEIISGISCWMERQSEDTLPCVKEIANGNTLPIYLSNIYIFSFIIIEHIKYKIMKRF